MQDQDKWRDRIEISLDNRQMFVLFSAMAVVVTLVFALGVVVGKRLALDAPTRAQTDPLALLDQISGEQANQEGTLTFAQTLTSKPPRPSARSSAPAAESPAEVAAPPSAMKEPPAIASTPVVVAPPPLAPPAAVRAQPAARVAGGEGDDPVVSVDPAPSVTPEKTEAVPAKDHVSGRYTLQLSSFQDRLEAEQFMDRLRNGGLAPRLIPAEIPGRGLWYRVRIGEFENWDQAVAAKQKFESSYSMIAYVARE